METNVKKKTQRERGKKKTEDKTEDKERRAVAWGTCHVLQAFR